MKKNKFVFLLLLIVSFSATFYITAYDPKKTQDNTITISPTPSSSSIPAKEVPKPSLTQAAYPRIDGSTATIPLSQAFAKSILHLSSEEARKFIKHNTTHFAYVNLLENNADLIFVTEPSSEELEMAAKKQIELEVVPIVKEAFVFLVNTKNPVTNLSTAQLRGIYTGRIKSWHEVGGEDKAIIAYQREPNSGSQTLMENTVMRGLKLQNAPKDVVQGMEGLIERIAKYDNSERALGYSVYYYAKTMYNKDSIKFLAVDGVTPDSKTISNGSYPFTSAYYAVLKKSDSADARSRQLLRWILGREGQQVCKSAGYIPLEVK